MDFRLSTWVKGHALSASREYTSAVQTLKMLDNKVRNQGVWATLITPLSSLPTLTSLLNALVTPLSSLPTLTSLLNALITPLSSLPTFITVYIHCYPLSLLITFITTFIATHFHCSILSSVYFHHCLLSSLPTYIADHFQFHHFTFITVHFHHLTFITFL